MHKFRGGLRKAFKQMKIRVYAAVALALAAGAANAADLRMPVKAAPMAAPAYAWSGFYAGVDVGYAFGSDNYILDPLAVATVGLGNLDLFGSRGFSGGVLAGYNMMIAPRWLAGIEADWNAQDIKTTFAPDPAAGTGSFEAKQKWAASLRARLGYLATPSTLFYVTGGWAWSEFDVSVTGIGGSITGSGNMDGFQGGIGAETAITSNLHARLEYLQTFYNGANFGADFSNNAGISEIKRSVGLGRVALVYQFGPAATAAATPMPATNWTGVYVAGSIGGAMGFGDVHIDGVGDIKGFGVAGPMPSLFVGYNYQFAPTWVAGIEAEIAPSVRSTDLKLGWLGAVRGRLGYLLMPNTMIYGTAGWLGTRFDDLVYQGVVVASGETLSGVQIGGGVEAAFAPGWSARLDYQYAIMRNVDLNFPMIPFPVPASVSPSGHIGRIAIVRRFGG
jgi:outer membrane immunogenic protein